MVTQMRIRPTRNMEEEEDVFIRESITTEDLPNAQQAQHRHKPQFDEFEAKKEDQAAVTRESITKWRRPLALAS